MITHLGRKTTRGLIIDILSEEFPLSAKKVYNQIKKSGKSVTYHAVYDRISELVKEGVLIKKDTEYMISPKWIEQTGEVISKLQIGYSSHIDEKIFKGAKKIAGANVLTFHSFGEVVNFIRSYTKNVIKSSTKEKPVTFGWIADHITGAILNFDNRVLLFKELKEKHGKYYTLIRGNTALDKAVVKINKAVGINTIKSGMKNLIDLNIGVYRNTVLIFIYPEEITKPLEKFYRKTKNMENMNLKELGKIMDKKAKVHVIVIREHEMANYLRNYIKSFF